MMTIINTYPTEKEVLNANHEQICRWYRFLRIARNTDEIRIINLIFKKWNQLGGTTSKISKKIGW